MSEVPQYRARRIEIEFMDRIRTAAPAAGLRMEDERRFHEGSVMPHLEMGLAAQWFAEAVERMPADSGAATQVATLLDVLEEQFESGDSGIDDVIRASFLEHLLGTPNSDAIGEMLPPKLRRSYDRMIGEQP